MANIKFYPYKDKGECKVYFRLKIGSYKDFRLSTGLTIKDANNWSSKTNLPTTSTAEYKALKQRLKKLTIEIEDYITTIEQSESDGLRDIQSKDIKNVVQRFNNLDPISDLELLLNYSDLFIKRMANSTFTKNGVQFRYKDNTINKYRNFQKVLEDYQTYLGKTIKLTDVNEDFAFDFLTYLTDEKERSINTKGRYVKRLKTIVKDAELNGQKVDPKYNLIKGFEDETIVTYLEFAEIDKIIDQDMPTERLAIAKDWFIISCFTAQRISDLHRFTKNNIQIIKGGRYLVLKQFKTSKNIMVPLHYKVEDVLKKYGGDFPPKFSENEQSQRSTLSRLIKDVCRISGIREKVKGRYNGVKGVYPKYQLISNHTGRRSFACNFYNLSNWSIQEVMNITGHDNPKNFYKYIAREDPTLSINARNKFDQMELEHKASKKSHLEIVKQVSNN